MTATLDHPSILLVEDSPNDVLITEEALRHGRRARSLRVVWDGEAALDFLHRRGKYADERRPDLVLLDLNVPKVHGLDVLEEIRRTPELASVPVVALTSSNAEHDVVRAYDAHVNAYVTKPLDLDEFINAIRRVEEFFLKIVRRPATQAGLDPLPLS
jgi:CheY-like chemotaxis protein